MARILFVTVFGASSSWLQCLYGGHNKHNDDYLLPDLHCNSNFNNVRDLLVKLEMNGKKIAIQSDHF